MNKLFIALTLASAATAADNPKPEVIIYFHALNQNLPQLQPAERLATQILKDAGITVEWRLGRANYGSDAEVIDAILTTPPPSYRPGALAYANLAVHSGTRIEIFY